jgi:hypothetical protein
MLTDKKPTVGFKTLIILPYRIGGCGGQESLPMKTDKAYPGDS